MPRSWLPLRWHSGVSARFPACRTRRIRIPRGKTIWNIPSALTPEIPAAERSTRRAQQAGSLASTMDIFFDNVFSDFIVQNRINEARAEIDRMIDRIERTVWDLKNRYAR